MNISKLKVESLAAALATGESAAVWAEKHAIPRRTAYRWAAQAETQAQIRSLRQGLVGDAVGQLAAAAGSAAETLKSLLAEDQPATVRLGAARAILSALIDVQTHAELADRLARLEGIADAQREGAP